MSKIITLHCQILKLMEIRKSDLRKLRILQIIKKSQQDAKNIPLIPIPQCELDAISKLFKEAEAGKNFSVY
jgi:hypothetical protein